MSSNTWILWRYCSEVFCYAQAREKMHLLSLSSVPSPLLDMTHNLVCFRYVALGRMAKFLKERSITPLKYIITLCNPCFSRPFLNEQK